MNCDAVKERLGTYCDGEASPDAVREIAAHLASCPVCADEMASICELASRLAPTTPTVVPVNLWSAIESRLPDPQLAHRGKWYVLVARRRLAVAASLLLAIGLGTVVIIWGSGGASRARAATIDFGTLLDGLSFGPERAFQAFLTQYNGRPVSTDEAKQVGRDLNFDVPEILPLGFRRKGLFALRIGNHGGVAASYARGTEFLAAIFHPPVKQEDFGTHQDYPCVVGQHHGHRVDVGEWKLVHVTDPTTCHCVLSRLDEKTELPAIFAAVAPGSVGGDAHDAGR